MTELLLLPDFEPFLAGYLRDLPDLAGLGGVAGVIPDDATKPWVRMTLLDVANEPDSQLEVLLSYMLQFDCYAGSLAVREDRSQREANDVGRTVRAALRALAPGGSQSGAAVDATSHVNRVLITQHSRLPDQEFEPARERYVITATIWVRVH